MNTYLLSWLLSYVFNALWQIPLVFAAAWVATRMLRRDHPRIEHRLWVGALLLQIALPACSLRIATLWSALRSLIPWASSADPRGGEIHILIGPATVSGGMLRLPVALEVGVLLAYACCVLFFAARLAWGLWQTHALARGATRLTLTGEAECRWMRYCRRLGITAPPPEIAASPRGIGPVTVGLRRGLLLLPPAFLQEIVPGDLDAVLAHELAHVQRRDFAKNLFYGLVSLPIVWHPLVWRTRARLAESRELICDAMAADAIAAEAVAGRRQYAQSLLRLASMLSRRASAPTLPALGILTGTDANTLERRVMTLTRKSAPMSTTRRILIATGCTIVALATCTSALALRTDVAALNPAPENPAAQTAAPTRIHVKSGIMAGNKISGDNPTYPKAARAKKIQGAVLLNAVIGKDGAMKSLHVVKTPDKLLSESALKAVRTWRYRPYLLNGEPIEVETTINVVYNLGS